MKFWRAGEGKFMNGFLPSRPASMDYALQGMERRSARPSRLSAYIIRGWDKLSHLREKDSQGFRGFKGWCKEHMAHYLLPPFLVFP